MTHLTDLPQKPGQDDQADTDAITPRAPHPAAPALLGIIAREERAAVEAIRAALEELGIDPGSKPIDLRALPFEGTWGSASTICRVLAGDLVSRELTVGGELDGLSKKEAKRKVNEHVAGRSQTLAEDVVARMVTSERFASVEAANGYINVSYDGNVVAAKLIGEVLEGGDRYGWAPPASRSDRVMIEHSQLNTHKAAHVGHLRNICLGVAVTNLSEAAGYRTIPVTYIGDIGRHVIRCLWCYQSFHLGEEPVDDAAKGRWLGDIYAEADARLSLRGDVVRFLETVVKEDLVFVTAVDRMLRYLWREGADGEDIAYLLGRIAAQQPIEIAELRDPNVLVTFWPIIGNQLREEAANHQGLTAEETAAVAEPADPAEIVPTMTPDERVAEWARLAEPITEWWPLSSQWDGEIKELFQLWETKDPEFVALWERTRAWSMADLRKIFDEFGARLDIWFTESEVEDDGRRIVRELLDRGIAEISDGLPVVKIDERLGLHQETYRTLPILRSDGTTLYATKDLALTQKKFEQYEVDRAIWVVDVRQSLYFDQIAKILELYGFEQAANTIHLGYEFVALPSGAISSRKGNAPMLEDVRDAMMERARTVIREKNPTLSDGEQETVARQVAIGAIKYVMLARDGNRVIVFDPEEALSFDGHAAPYIQYAHARACRILEHGGRDASDLAGALEALDFGTPKPEELSLLGIIADFPGIVRRAADEYRPLHITNYVFEVAKRFNDFYHACPVLKSDEPVRTARLALVAATRATLRNGLALLGIEAPEQM